jgi:phage shock protein PspC (stress-responsive transcriptional regulator)
MKRIYLSQTDKKIAGIFGGIAEVYELDASLLRLGAIFLGMATGLVPMLVTYLAGWMVLPKGPPKSSLPTSP